MNRDSTGLILIILVVLGVGLRGVEAGAVEAVGAAVSYTHLTLPTT